MFPPKGREDRAGARRPSLRSDAWGHKDHAAGKRDWEKAQSKEVFVLGSKDETAGCQGCQLVHPGNGLFSVKLRLPNADSDRFATFHADFSYCVDAILAALRSGKALCFRLLCDDKHWRMSFSTDIEGGPFTFVKA
jgi:hypothetical protein